jgi:hypothetical protein
MVAKWRTGRLWPRCEAEMPHGVRIAGILQLLKKACSWSGNTQFLKLRSPRLIRRVLTI